MENGDANNVLIKKKTLSKKERFLFFYKNYVIIYIVKIKDIKIMFLILTPENKEVFTKLLRHLDKKGWTFGKSIKDYRGTIIDLYIFLYENKTIRIGAASSLDYVSKTVPIITVNDAPRDDLLFEYDKWIEGFKKELEKSILKGVYEYGKPSL